MVRLRHNLNGIQCGVIDSHTHLGTLKRILSVVGILFSIEKVILQCFQIHLIILGVSSCLMIFENISLMDTHAVHNLCCHLVCCKILFLFLKSEIIPHHILCLEEIFVIHILHSQSHGRQMVTVHNQNHILRIIGELICQLFDKIIHLMNLVYVVLPLVVQFLGRCTGNCDLRIFQYRFRRIISMSLYGNGVYIIRSFCGIQTFDDLISKHAVLGPAQRVLLILILHILSGSKGIKSQIRENASSSIEIRLIVMYGVCGISQIFQHIRSTLTGGFLKNTLIRIFTRAKIMKAHSGNGLKLCVGSSGSYRRNLVITGRIFFHQFPEIRDRVLGNIQIIYQCGIKKGLQL